MKTKTQPTVLTRAISLDIGVQEAFSNLHRVSGFFFLDSSMSDHPLSRWSYMGIQPYRTLRSRGRGLDVVEGKKIRHLQGPPVWHLSRMLAEDQVSGGTHMMPFFGGGVGYFSYEFGNTLLDLPSKRIDDLGLPEMYVAFYNALLAYNHHEKRWYGAGVDRTGGKGTTIRKRLGVQIEKLAEMAQKPHRGPLATPITESEPGDSDAPSRGTAQEIEGLRVMTTMSRGDYLKAVEGIKDHITRGDIYQANLTQRWSVPFDHDPGLLYEALRKASPSPFGFYLNSGECAIAGASPESFLSLSGQSIETRPIKGTRPRGADEQEDVRLREELLQSSKDQAELTMIADLERNDLGRICVPGSIEVESLHQLESFSNVHHLISVVKGTLNPGTTLEDIFQATFPGGSITGAPKRRAMEILDGIEETVRGPYTGAMGYLGLDGSLQLNVAIRTLVMTQGACHIGVGGGIVADSEPEAEYDECVAKAKHMIAALKNVAKAPAPSEEPTDDSPSPPSPQP